MQNALLSRRERFTYAEYKEWPATPRYELIDGEAYMMAPGPTCGHQDIAGHLYYLLKSFLNGKPCRPYMSPLDVVFPKDDEDVASTDTVLQPDVAVVCDRKKINMDGHITGAPDFVAEVLSPSSIFRDFDLKKQKYEQFGVREYWVLSLWARSITQYKLINGVYEGTDITKGRIESFVIEGFGLDLSELFAVLDL